MSVFAPESEQNTECTDQIEKQIAADERGTVNSVPIDLLNATADDGGKLNSEMRLAKLMIRKS